METDTPVSSKKVLKKETGSSKPIKEKTKEPKKDISKSYNEFKKFHGRDYTGMKIGRSHKSHYDEGEWKETKVTPDLWEISLFIAPIMAGR